MRSRYVPAGRVPNFSFGFITSKTTFFEEISLTLINQTRYILNIGGAWNKEKIFKH